MSTIHSRQTSLPPPYQARTSEDTSMPYLDDLSPTSLDLYQSLPYYASLPAFDAPPNYSRRLRRLIESRRRPTHLSLIIPVEKPKIIEQIFLDNDSSTSSSFDIDQEKSTNLLGMPCEDNLETYSFNSNNTTSNRQTLRKKLQKYRRRSIKDDREISWTAFAGMASILFFVLCACSIIIAWSTGLFQGLHGLEIMQAQMHGMENAVWVPTTESSKATISTEESMVLDSTDLPAMKASNVVQEIAEDMPMLTRREEIQKRAERRRRNVAGGATAV